MSARVKIGSTYYRKGFFNQTKNMPWLPRSSNYSNISIMIQCIGPNTSTRISAEIRYRGQNGIGAWINRSHYARIFAKPSKLLVSWFRDNLHEGDEVLFEQVDELNYTMRPASKIEPPSLSEIKTSERKETPGEWSKEDDWFWEGNVQDKIMKHLKVSGFDRVTGVDTYSKEPGPDTTAYYGGKKWVIEVKGYPSDKYVEDWGDRKKGAPKPTPPATQARHWFSEAMMSVLLVKSEDQNVEVGLGFPRMDAYLMFLKRVSYVREKLGIHVFLVEENNSVSQFSPRESIS